MEECPVCPKKHPAAFMEKHLKTKHNIDSRKFKCEFCHKMFTRQGHLNRHRKIHTGNKKRGRGVECKACLVILVIK